MTRDVKTQKKGDGFNTETILIQSNTQTGAQTVEAYRDLITTLQACIDANLLRAHYNAPRRVTATHTDNGWVIETLAMEVQE